MATPTLLYRSTDQPSLPEELITKIIEQSILDNSLKESVLLRRVCKWFDNELIRLLFVVEILPNIAEKMATARPPQNLCIASLQGFMTVRELTEKSDRRARRGFLQQLHLLPEHISSQPCLFYNGLQNCDHRESTSSTSLSSGCPIHTVFATFTAAFGNKIFTPGSAIFDIIRRPGPSSKQFLDLLIACYQNRVNDAVDALHEIDRESGASESSLHKIFSTCLWVGVRKDNVTLVSRLLEDAADRDLYTTALYNESPDNVLIEAIRLGHIEIFKILLKWKWRFIGHSWTYSRTIKLILYCKLHVPKDKDLETRKALLSTLFEWTDEWRNIEEMKAYLIKAGSQNLQWAIELIVESMKKCHFYRHERGNEGSFHSAEPLRSIAISDNIEIVKMFLDNRKILLPHTTEEKDMEMRYSTLCSEYDRCQGPRVDMVKTIMHCSSDLIEEETKLQTILLQQYNKPVETWRWLAEQAGLEAKTSDKSAPETTGTAMLSKAVAVLNIETVQYLTTKGQVLKQAISAPQVYEDDIEAIAKLETISTLLKSNGQGGTRERKAVDVTFLPGPPTVPSPTLPSRRFRYSKSAVEETVTELCKPRIETEGGPKFLKRNILAARSNLRRHRKTGSTSFNKGDS